MRHSKTEKSNTHKCIVTIAAKTFREEGLAGIGIADLMKEAGLTVGGFYKHFKSRNALVSTTNAPAVPDNRWREADLSLLTADRYIRLITCFCTPARRVATTSSAYRRREPKGKFCCVVRMVAAP